MIIDVHTASLLLLNLYFSSLNIMRCDVFGAVLILFARIVYSLLTL